LEAAEEFQQKAYSAEEAACCLCLDPFFREVLEAAVLLLSFYFLAWAEEGVGHPFYLS
jgi:hypothetical protein